MDPVRREAKYYQTKDKKSPFRNWLKRHEDIRSTVWVRIRRIEEYGNYGDCEPVGDGVFELRIHIGPGYRVYFGIDDDCIILLWGGLKKSQESDIRKAKAYWTDYNA